MKLPFQLIVSAVLITAAMPARSADWQPVTDSEAVYDKSRVVKVAPHLFRVWEKYVLNEDDLNYMRQEGMAQEVKDYAYTLTQHLVDCKAFVHGIVTTASYNTNYQLIAPAVHIKEKDIKMLEAFPETNGEALIKTVCAKHFQAK